MECSVNETDQDGDTAPLRIRRIDSIWWNGLHSEAGASLAEIAITALIIAITTLIIASFSRNTMTMSADARAMNAAHLAGEQKIVELSAETFPAATGNDTTDVDGIRCIRSWVLQDAGYLQQGIVTVRWNIAGNSRKIVVAGAIP